MAKETLWISRNSFLVYRVVRERNIAWLGNSPLTVHNTLRLYRMAKEDEPDMGALPLIWLRAGDVAVALAWVRKDIAPLRKRTSHG